MILIKNANIIDGSGSPAFSGEILIREDKILDIGKNLKAKADRVFDANGNYVIPGIIDINTDSDHYLTLFSDPEQESFLLQGVTTIIGGQSGSSLAPILYGRLDSFKNWSRPKAFNTNWSSLEELFSNLKSKKLGVNFGTLTGYTTIRGDILKSTNQDATLKELESIRQLFEKSLEDGSFGLSLGLSHIDSRLTGLREIKKLAEISFQDKRLISIQLRNNKDLILKSLKEAFELNGLLESNVLINNFKPILGHEKEYGEALSLFRNIKDQNINFDCHPSEWSLISIQSLFPDWLKNSASEDFIKELSAPHNKALIKKEINNFNPHNFKIAHSSTLPHVTGQTVEQYALDRNIDYKDAILHLAIKSRLELILFSKNINVDYAIQALMLDSAIISSNSPGFNLTKFEFLHEKILNSFRAFFHFAAHSKLISLEKAVSKATSIPAKKLNLINMGSIKKGYSADLSILNKDFGVESVFLNGKLAVENGSVTKNLSGKILKR